MTRARRVPTLSMVRTGTRQKSHRSHYLSISAACWAPLQWPRRAALALAIAATIICSAAGATLGGLLADAVAKHPAKRVAEELARGGIVLWLKTANAEQERRAIAILRHAGAHDVHVHEIQGLMWPSLTVDVTLLIRLPVHA